MKRTVLFCDGQRSDCDVFSFPSDYFNPEFNGDLTYDLFRVAEQEDGWQLRDGKAYCPSCFKEVFSTYDPFADTLKISVLGSLRANLDSAAVNTINILLEEYPERMEKIFGDDIYLYLGMFQRNRYFSSDQKSWLINKIQIHLDEK